MNSDTIVHKPKPLGNGEAKAKLASGLLRAVTKRGKRGVDVIAIEADCSGRTIAKALAMETLPAGETLFNLLLADSHVLDELLARVGYCAVPLQAAEAQDLDLCELLGAVMGALAKSRSPNSPGGSNRVHSETLVVADLARAVLPMLTAIVREADGIRGVA
jgi:hypothetical protein